MKSCAEWMNVAMPQIMWNIRRNAAIHGRHTILYHDVLIGIKLFKHGYSGFGPPPTVLSVYEYVFQ